MQILYFFYLSFALLNLVNSETISEEYQDKISDDKQSSERLPPIFTIHGILSLTVISILVGMCQAGGIGGGPIISPILMILMGLEQRRAVWDTYVLLLGGAIGNYIKLRKERIPETGSSIINYKLVLIAIPLLLSGAVIGVVTGKYIPKIVIGTLLFIILIQVLFKTYRSFKRIRAKEIEREHYLANNKNNVRGSWIELQFITDEYSDLQAQTAYAYNQKLILQPSDVDYKEELMAEQLQLTSLTSTLIFKSPQLLAIHEAEKILYPTHIFLQYGIQICLVIGILLIKGTQVFPSLIGIQFCSLTYHSMNFLLLFIGLISVTIYRKQFTIEENIKEQLGYDFNREGRLTTYIDSTVFNSACAGFLGGLVGLGGGIILTPIWLNMGMPSSRAAPSASFMVIFSSFISTFVQLIVGAYTLFEVAILLVSNLLISKIVSGVGSYLVSGFLNGLVIKYKRESIIIQVLILVILLGLIVLPFNTISSILKDPQESMKFGEFC